MIYYKDQNYYLELAIVDKTGNFLTGQVVTYTIYKSSNNTLVESGSLTEIGVSGVYKKLVLFTEAIQYRVEYVTPNKFDNVIESFIISENSLDSLDDKIKEILGLSQSNYRLTNTVYDRAMNLINGTIKIYPTAIDVDNDTNAIAEYEIFATYNKKNQMTDYKVKKI